MIDLEMYSNPTVLNVAAIYPSTECLGPGKRIVLWLQGCLKRCPGCITPEMQPLKKRELIEVKLLANIISVIDSIEGITIVGGEPFLQYRALLRFLEFLKRADLTVMIYTGYMYEELLRDYNSIIFKLLSLTDILIDGPYVMDENNNEMWRGSSNQRIFFLSERYKGWEWVKKEKKRTLSIHYNRNGKYIIIGIPPKHYFSDKSLN